MSWLAEQLTQQLIRSSVVEEGDAELYSYGLFLVISWLYSFLITVSTGLFTGIVWESILFYFVFILLRTYAGGIHAKTELSCTTLTTVVLIASVIGIRYISSLESYTYSFLLLAVGSFCIVILCPVDSKEKPLDAREKKRYRAICIIMVFLCVLIALLAKHFCLQRVFCAIVCGIFLEALLLFSGKILYTYSSP